VAYTGRMAPTDGSPNAPRPILGILALLAAALVAVLSWKAWQVSKEAEAMAAAAPPPAPARVQQPVELVYGRIVTASRPVPAPPVDLATIDGKRFTLASTRGEVVMLNFWATWCPPCAKEMPSMVALGEALTREHPGKFRMVAVSVDETPDQVKQFFSQPPYKGPPRGVTLAIEPGAGEVTRNYYCQGRGACGPNDVKFPESYILDRDGRIVAYVVGDMDWSTPAARTYLEALIGG